MLAERVTIFEKLLRRVKLQAQRDAEAVAQRRGQLARARRRADEREVRQIEADGVRARPLANDDVDGVVLHRGVQDLLHAAVQAVDLVDEQDVPLAQIRQKRRKVARLFNGGAGRDADVHSHFLGNNARERRLAEARRAVQQHVVERFAALFRRRNEDGKVALRLLLPDVFRERLRAQRALLCVLAQESLGHDRLFINIGSKINAQKLTSFHQASQILRRARRKLNSIVICRDRR